MREDVGGPGGGTRGLGSAAAATPPPSRGRRRTPTCEDCFFHRRMLCALDLDQPCSTFRPDTPEGLVPPRQPSLLLRGTGAAGAAAEPA